MSELTEELQSIETELEYIEEVDDRRPEKERTEAQKRNTLMNYLGVD